MDTENTDKESKKAKKETTFELGLPKKITELPICGIVMPIASMGNEYTENHWKDVFNIIKEAAKTAGYNAQLVSHSDSVGVIHNDIVQNLYQNEIVVCDVSGKNPNVMFELGMRLTFDKPTIIIKDDYTNYSFDISSIRHEEYPRDLRYNLIQDFKEKLAKRIKETVLAYKDNNYTTFLKHFKNLQIKAPELETKEVSINEVVLNKLDIITKRLSRIENDRTKKEDAQPLSLALQIFLNESFQEYINSLDKDSFEKYITNYSMTDRINLFLSYLKLTNNNLHKSIREIPVNDFLPYFDEVEEPIVNERISNILNKDKI